MVPEFWRGEERVAFGTEIVKLPVLVSAEELVSWMAPPDHAEGPDKVTWVLEDVSVPFCK